RRPDPGGAPTRRPHAVRARGANWSRQICDRTLGAGCRSAESRDARRAGSCLRLRPPRRARPTRRLQPRATPQERAPPGRAPGAANPPGTGEGLRLAKRPPFDPYAILAALDRRRVAYIVIGS